MADVIKKKRGRKPKHQLNIINPIIINNENVNSEDEKIICHLPITLNEINNNEINNLEIDTNIFIVNKNEKKYTIEMTDTNDVDSTINLSQNTMLLTNNVNKVITHNINYTENTKCWWCRHSFSNIATKLPENYYNETFFCIGHFCSYNCAKSYNLDLNDTLTCKRESLLNLLYFCTYSEYIIIKPAPHWTTLKDYGGFLTIEEFRDNFTHNNKDYLVLHPPLISRQMQIEESYKMNKLKEVHIDKINKIYSEIDSEYTIKRNRPINTSQFNLESTMGLIKTKRR